MPSPLSLVYPYRPLVCPSFSPEYIHYLCRLTYIDDGHKVCDDKSRREKTRSPTVPPEYLPVAWMQDPTEHNGCATPLPKKRREWRDSFINTLSSKKRRLSHSTLQMPQ